MDITTNIDGTSAVLSVNGNLTVATAPSLKAAFAALPEDVADITLDLKILKPTSSGRLKKVLAE